MKLEISVSIVAAVVWVTIEGYLILRDKSVGKGTTTQDRRTRIYNTISLELAFCLSPIICWLPALQFAGFHTSIVFSAGMVTMGLGFILRHWSIYVLVNTSEQLLNWNKITKWCDQDLTGILGIPHIVE
jgi:hypothetical protein